MCALFWSVFLHAQPLDLGGIRSQAIKGDTTAQVKLGQVYDSLGDYPEAKKWFWMAAQMGNPIAQFHMGLIYGTGKGVPADSKEALKYFRKAWEPCRARSRARSFR